jgi:hypothetical protein
MSNIGIAVHPLERRSVDPGTGLIVPALERFIPATLDAELSRRQAGAWRYDVFNASRVLRFELLQACRPEQTFQETLREVWHAWQCAGCVTGTMPRSSSLAEARARLPVWAMEMLFKHSASLAAQTQPPSPCPAHRLLSVDATLLPVPNAPELRAHFGVLRTQHGEAYYPQALAVWLALVGTGSVIAEHLGPSRRGEERIAPQLLSQSLRPGDLVLGDGRIGTYPTLVQTARCGAFFLVRACGPLRIERNVLRCWSSDDLDVRLELWEATRRHHAELALPPNFDTRAVRFEIPARDVLNQTEHAVFLTNLPRQQFGLPALRSLALLRWSHETVNNDIKTHLGLGNIRSQRPEGIRREVLAHLCLSNLLRLLLSQAHPEIPLAGSFTAARSALYQANQQLRLAPERQAELLNLIPRMIRQQGWMYRPVRTEPRLTRPNKRRHGVFKTPRAQWRAARKTG